MRRADDKQCHFMENMNYKQTTVDDDQKPEGKFFGAIIKKQFNTNQVQTR